MRRRLYDIIEYNEGLLAGKIYDFSMMFVILLSFSPLVTHKENMALSIIDQATAFVFILDYILRWLTADYKLKRGWKSFIIYIVSPMAIIDLISILPSINLLQKGFRLLKLARLLKSLKVFKVFKVFRYSKNIMIVLNVFKNKKDILLTVFGFSVGYIIITAMIIFNVEPETFPTILDAIYWSVISLTTVGYGDLYAVSTFGKIVTMISALLGVAVIALPAGIIIAGYQEELSNWDNEMKDESVGE